MQVNVIRGSDQIGGSIIEVRSEQVRIILDAGTELDEAEKVVVPEVPGLFQGAADCDAVLVSHYHQDHTGLLNNVLDGIPIYMTRKMFLIHTGISKRIGKKITYHPVIIDAEGQNLDGSYSFQVKDIRITPFLCDHSAYDSYMYLLETSDDSILYTGDFRSNGRMNFDDLLNRLPEHVNRLICEGTTLSRNTKQRNEKEEDIETQMAGIMQTDAPVFVIAATTNMDRLVSVYNACRRTKRTLAMDVFQADMLDIAGNLPAPSSCKDMKVVQVGKPDHAHSELARYQASKISRETLQRRRFTMLIRTSDPMIKFLDRMRRETLAEATLIFSMWHGYRKDERTGKFIDYCMEKGMKVVVIHTSGHADRQAIQAVIDKVKPMEMIPVHTVNPQQLMKMSHQ